MKKKFLISGVAVFLVVLLCSSALFAFADSYPVTSITVDDGYVATISSIDSPATSGSTSHGGLVDYYWHSASSGFYYIFPSYFNFFYYNESTISVYGLNSYPEVGSEFDGDRLTISGILVSDRYSGNSIYKYDLPNTYPYYANSSFIYYTPPLFMKVNSTITGFFSAAGDFFDGVMSVPILAILVIGVPVTSLIIALTLSLTVGRKRNKSYKKSRRRR